MAHLKYYRDERARHPDLRAAPCTQEEATEAISILTRLLLPMGLRSAVALKFTTRGTWSYGGHSRITLSLHRLNWLTVLHEFAHTWDIRTRPQAKQYHDAQHVALVNRLAIIARARGWLQGCLLIDSAQRMNEAFDQERQEFAPYTPLGPDRREFAQHSF